MKNLLKLKTILSLLVVVMCAFSVTACGDDDDDASSSSVCSGTWYLVSYDGSVCEHGEYMKFSGSKLYWNKRLGGRNTTYNYRESSNGFVITDGDQTITFEVKKIDSKNIVTYSSDDMIRYWKR